MIYIDFETKSELDVKNVGPHEYSIHPSTDVYCMAYRLEHFKRAKIWINGDPWPTDLDKPIGQLESIEAHNVMFERCIWNNIMVPRYDWPKLPNSIWCCSSAKALYASLPRSLAGAASAMDLTPKDESGRRCMLKLAKPRRPTKHNPKIWHDDPSDFKKLYSYCKNDVDVERELSKALTELPEVEKEIWKLDQVINSRGVHVDTKAISGALAIIEKIEKKAKAEIEELTEWEIETSGQIAEIVKWCYNKGVKLPDLTKGTVEKYLKKDLPNDVKRILEIRQELGRSSVRKYQAMQTRANADDNRIRSLLVYHGASTGRWAGQGIQIQNFPKGTLKDQDDIDFAIDLIKAEDLDGLEFYYGNPMQVLSSCLRGMLCAPEGKVLIAGDYTAIEARILMWLVDDKKALNIFKSGGDIYKDLAAQIYNVPIGSVTNDQRFVGKQCVLGLGYQMGAEKFKKQCASYGQPISDKLANHAVKTYREKYWKVKEYWAKIEEIAKTAVKTNKQIKLDKIVFFTKNDFLYCKLPSDRLLSYYKPELKLAYTPWQTETLKLTYMGINSKTHKWERLDTYGGKLTENVVQAIARDILAHGMINIEKAGYPIVLSIHDEAVSETEKDFADAEEYRKIMCVLPKWAEGIPIDAETWIGERFKK